MSPVIAVLGYYDTTVLIAVVGLYVLLAVLWVIYSLVDRESERSAAAISIERRRQTPSDAVDVNELQREIVLLRRQADESEENIQVLQESVDRIRLLLQLQMQQQEYREQSETESVVVHHAEDTDADADNNDDKADLAADNIVSIGQPLLDRFADYSPYADPEMGVILTKRPENSDDLTRIWGVGAVNQDLLNQNGVFYFEQIANWNDYNIWKFNEILSFKGRIEREQWVDQARRLADQADASEKQAA